VLEVGPGRGYDALDVAPRLVPGGTLDVTMHRADGRGLTNIVPTQGDAQALPYAEAATLQPPDSRLHMPAGAEADRATGAVEPFPGAKQES
jgi:hypothetical protein